MKSPLRRKHELLRSQRGGLGFKHLRGQSFFQQGPHDETSVPSVASWLKCTHPSNGMGSTEGQGNSKGALDRHLKFNKLKKHAAFGAPEEELPSEVAAAVHA